MDYLNISRIQDESKNKKLDKADNAQQEQVKISGMKKSQPEYIGFGEEEHELLIPIGEEKLDDILDKKINVKKPKQAAAQKKQESLEEQIDNAYHLAYKSKQHAFGNTDGPAFTQDYHDLGWNQKYKRKKKAEKKKVWKDNVDSFEKVYEIQKADKKTRPEAPRTNAEMDVELKRFMGVKLSDFRFKNDEEFSNNLTRNYRLVGNLDEMQRYVDLYAEADQNMQGSKIDLEGLARQIAFLREIRDWMDARRALMSNPYYVLLSSKETEDYDRIIEGLKEKTGALIDENGVVQNGKEHVEKATNEFDRIREFLELYQKERSCNFKRRKFREEGDTYKARFRQLTDSIGTRDFNKAKQKRNDVFRQREEDRRKQEDERKKRLFEEELKRKADEEARAKQKTLEGWKEGAKEAIAGKKGNPKFFRKPKYLDENEAHSKIEELQKLDLSSLQMGSVDDILKNMESNNVLFDLADEAEGYLAQWLQLGLSSFTSDEVILCRAKLSVLREAKEKQIRVLEKLNYGDENLEKTGVKPEDWAFENDLLMLDPKSVLDKHRITLQKQHEEYSVRLKEFWEALNPNKKLNEDDLRVLKFHFQKNVMFWDSIRHAKEALAQEDRLTKLYIDQYCKKNNISAEEKERVQNDPALMYYLQGKGDKELEGNLNAAFGSEDDREGLKLLINDEAINAIKDTAPFFAMENSNEAGFLNGIALKMRAVNMMHHGGGFFEKTLKNHNEPLDDLPEVKEARAVQKFSEEILKERMDRLITLSDSANIAYLAGINFQDIQKIRENRLMHRSYLDKYTGDGKEQIQTVFDELNALQISAQEVKTSTKTVKTELKLDSDMNAIYQLYRKAEGADTEAFEKERTRNQELITTIEGMSHNPLAVGHEEIQDLRLLCLSQLTGRALGIPEDRYYDLSTESLKRLTLNCLKNNWTEQQLEEALKNSSKAAVKEAPADKEVEWTLKEKDAIDLMAEVSEKEQDENSLLQILLGHVELIADTAAENARDTSFIGKKIDELEKIEKPDEEQQKELYRLLDEEKKLSAVKKRPKRKDSLSTIKNKLNIPERKLQKALLETASGVAEYLRDMSETKELTADSVKKLLSKKDKGLLQLLKGYAAKIDQEVTASFDGIQEDVKAATDAIYEMKDNIPSLFDDEKKEEKPTMEERLNSKWTDAYGEGRFVQIVLNNYFTKSGQKEKRRMMSSILRHSKPALKNTAKSSLKVKRAGRYLAGMVKGAGPLLQKLMQSLPEEVLTEELREMVEDVKSNLEPIPKDYVDKKLKEMVAASNGAVSEITVVSSLGAASVGQTFLCNIKGKDIPDGTQVVVKLLRPDMEEKIKAEKEVMLSCTEPEAIKTVEEWEPAIGKNKERYMVITKKNVPDKDNSMMDGGAMKETYLGMLEKISEELDLRIEAENCEKGRIYDTGDGVGTVESVKIFKLIPPSKDYMLQTKAEGQTLDKLLKDIKNTRREVIKLAGLYEKRDDGKLYYRGMLNTSNMEQVKAGRKRLTKLLKETKKRYQHLAKMGRVWAQTSLFGDKGFFHGDMHAGNIMVSSDKATVLDFGNASELDKTQSTIKLMSIAATCNQSGDFLQWFTDLLPKDSRSKKLLTDRNNMAFRLKVQKEILDTFEECGNAVGEKIYLSMMVLQKHGIEIPQTMFYFSQSELRLQNSIGEMKSEIIRLKMDIQTLDHLNVRINECSADAVLLTQSSLSNSRDIKADYQSAISSLSVPDRQSFLKELKDQNPGASEAFRKKYLSGADHVAKIQYGQKFSDEFYDEYNVDELDTTDEEVKALMEKYRLKPMDAEPSELRAEFLEIQKKINSPGISVAEKRKLRDAFTVKMLNQFSNNKVLSPFGDMQQFGLNIIEALETGDVGKLDIVLNAMSRVPDMVRLSDDTTKLEELKKKAAAESDAEKKKEIERKIDILAEQIADLYMDIQNMITDQNVTISMVKVKLSEGINIFPPTSAIEIENNIRTFHAFKELEHWDINSDKLDELEKEWRPLYQKEKKNSLAGEETERFEELNAALKKEVTRCMRLLNYARGVRAFTKELTPWFSDPDGGAELKRLYEDFRSIQQKYVKIYIDEGKEDEDVKASVEYAQRQFLAGYKPMAVKRLRSYAEMFDEEPVEVNDVQDFMQILGDVTSKQTRSLMMTLAGNGILKYGSIMAKRIPATDRAELDEAIRKLKT